MHANLQGYEVRERESLESPSWGGGWEGKRQVQGAAQINVMLSGTGSPGPEPPSRWEGT